MLITARARETCACVCAISGSVSPPPPANLNRGGSNRLAVPGLIAPEFFFWRGGIETHRERERGTTALTDFLQFMGESTQKYFDNNRIRNRASCLDGYSLRLCFLLLSYSLRPTSVLFILPQSHNQALLLDRFNLAASRGPKAEAAGRNHRESPDTNSPVPQCSSVWLEIR